MTMMAAATGVPTIEVWVLTIWSALTPPFEAGQYITQERCQQGAVMQIHHYRPKIGAGITARCELKRL
jgi:hypothetical protein